MALFDHRTLFAAAVVQYGIVCHQIYTCLHLVGSDDMTVNKNV